MKLIQHHHHKLTCKGSLWGLCIFIIGEKLLFTGTLAPRNGLNRYGFGTPTPNTYFKDEKNAIWVALVTNSLVTSKSYLDGKILTTFKKITHVVSILDLATYLIYYIYMCIQNYFYNISEIKMIAVLHKLIE